jgi:hypothetical protein
VQRVAERVTDEVGGEGDNSPSQQSKNVKEMGRS